VVAFGVGELVGIIGGLAIGSSWIETLKVLFGMFTAIILLYGVWYWNEKFSSSDLVKSFSDFVKVAVWFLYVSGVSYLFFTTTDLKVDFYPAFVNREAFSKGIQVSLPGGTVKLVDADKPYTSLTANNVPLLYSFLEFPDALETMLITKLTLSADKSGWDGYFANNPDPSRIFSKCVFNALSQVSSDEAVTWVCSKGTEIKAEDAFKFAAPQGLMVMLLEKLGIAGTEGICRGIRTSGPFAAPKVDEKVKTCLTEEKNRIISYLSDRTKEITKAYENGELSESVYLQKLKEIDNLKTKWNKIYNTLTQPDNYEVYASAYASKLIRESSQAPIPRSVEDSGTGTLFKAAYDWIGTKITEAFVGEYLLLDLFEAFQKFSLMVELGFVLPVLFLLSMLPDASSPTGSRIGFAVKGVGIYFLIKLARVLVFLIYLIAHNYFISNVLVG